MSIESWNREFYPVDVWDVPQDQAIQHSLTKWQGLNKTALRRHKVWVVGSRLYDAQEKVFRIDDSTCALCVHYASVAPACHDCPLALLRGGVPCDSAEGDERYFSDTPYGKFVKQSDPRPMQRLLARALKLQMKEPRP